MGRTGAVPAVEGHSETSGGRRAVPLRLAVTAATLTLTLLGLALVAPGAAALFAAFVALALAALLYAFSPPVRRQFDAEWALAGTGSRSPLRRRQSLAYLSSHAETLPDFARSALPDVLVRATHDTEASVRWQAIASAAKVAPRLPEAGRGALIEALITTAERDGDAPVRGGAARAIATCLERSPPVGQTRLAALLPKLVEDPDTGVVASWCDVLPRIHASTGEHATPELVDALLRMMGSDDPVKAWAARRAAVAVAAHASPDARAPVLRRLREDSLTGDAKGRIDALEELMAVVPSLTHAEAAGVREHAERAVTPAEPAVTSFAFLLWSLAARPGGALDRGPPPSPEATAGGSSGIVAWARAIAVSQTRRLAGVAPERFPINASPEVAPGIVAGIEDAEPLVRRASRAAIRASFPRLVGPPRASAIGALLAIHEKPEQTARTNASAALVDIRESLTAAELDRVAHAVAGLMAGGHEAVRRQATVTAVGIEPRVPPEARAALYAALREMSRDPDSVVADQAKDSLAALRGR